MNTDKYKIRVYIDDGRVFVYEVTGESSAREHSDAIARGGYRHWIKDGLEFYPVWRILKVKVVGHVSTNYVNSMEGT